MDAILRIIMAAAILVILFYAYSTKNKLASYVSYVILAAIALGMALNGMASLFGEVDFLAFLVDMLNAINGVVIFIEIGLILYLLFLSKVRNKNTVLKAAIIVYVVVALVVEFNII